MSFTVFRSNVLPLYRPLAWKNYVLDRSLRKPFSSNGRWAYVPQLSSSMQRFDCGRFLRRVGHRLKQSSSQKESPETERLQG